MKHVWRKHGKIGIAACAGIMLVLQTLVGAFATGAAAASPMLDAFGNPICAASLGPSVDPSGHGKAEHTALPGCCIVSCGMFASVCADGRSPHSLANPLSASTANDPVAFEGTAHAFALERRPGSARSPPFTA